MTYRLKRVISFLIIAQRTQSVNRNTRKITKVEENKTYE